MSAQAFLREARTQGLTTRAPKPSYRPAGPYELPVIVDSEEDALRYCHADLAGMDALDLWAEGKAVEQALFNALRGPDRGHCPILTPDGFRRSGVDWLQERLAAVKRVRQARCATR